ncbi:MAG TPA: hypothetical protein VGB97_01805 [Candidatus Paceibacterota bacterium]|jgi:hypothetical protein
MVILTRRTLLGSLFLSYAVFAADAASGQRVRPIIQGGLKGPHPEEAFAQMIEGSLAKDETGHATIPNARETFLRPVDVWETLRRLNPGAGPTFYAEQPTPLQLRMMVSFIRTTRLRELTHTSRFFNTTVTGSGANRRIIYDNISTLGAGIEVLEDPRTGDPIFKRDCGNGLGQCVYIDFEVREGDEFEVIWERFYHASDHCFRIRRVAETYQHDSKEASWTPIVPGKICGDCTFAWANEIIDKVPLAAGPIAVKPGKYQLRLIRGERVALCLKRRSPHPISGIKSSYSVDISWRREDYHRVGEEWHARVHYDTRELQTDGIKLGNGPRSLVWYPASLEDLEAMEYFMVQERPG